MIWSTNSTPSAPTSRHYFRAVACREFFGNPPNHLAILRVPLMSNDIHVNKDVIYLINRKAVPFPITKISGHSTTGFEHASYTTLKVHWATFPRFAHVL